MPPALISSTHTCGGASCSALNAVTDAATDVQQWHWTPFDTKVILFLLLPVLFIGVPWAVVEFMQGRSVLDRWLAFTEWADEQRFRIRLALFVYLCGGL